MHQKKKETFEISVICRSSSTCCVIKHLKCNVSIFGGTEVQVLLAFTRIDIWRRLKLSSEMIGKASCSIEADF